MAAHASGETTRAIADYQRLGRVACTDAQKALVRTFNAIRGQINAAPVGEDDLMTFLCLNDAKASAADGIASAPNEPRGQ